MSSVTSAFYLEVCQRRCLLKTHQNTGIADSLQVAAFLGIKDLEVLGHFVLFCLCDAAVCCAAPRPAHEGAGFAVDCGHLRE